MRYLPFLSPPFFSFWCFETGSCHVVVAGLKPTTGLLPQPRGPGLRCAPPHLTSFTLYNPVYTRVSCALLIFTPHYPLLSLPTLCPLSLPVVCSSAVVYTHTHVTDSLFLETRVHVIDTAWTLHCSVVNDGLKSSVFTSQVLEL